jgi:hypothetical protein
MFLEGVEAAGITLLEMRRVIPAASTSSKNIHSECIEQ